MSLFFFFKQKTAYELRISDWTSDVCSSDLPAELIGDEPAAMADIDLQVRKVVEHAAQNEIIDCPRALERIIKQEARVPILRLGIADFRRIGMDEKDRKSVE